MISFIVSMSIVAGDAEEVSVGKVSLDYIKKLDAILDAIEEKGEHTEEDEANFDKIWEDIAAELKLDVTMDDGLFNIDKTTGEVSEVVAVDPKLKEALENAGQTIRMKSDAVKA